MRFSFKYFICFTIFLIFYWIISSILRSSNCSQAQVEDNTIQIIELNKKSDIYHSHEFKDKANSKKTFLYNRYLPLVFVAGVPGKRIKFNLIVRCLRHKYHYTQIPINAYRYV